MCMRQHSDPSRWDAARESGMPRKRSGERATKGLAGIATATKRARSVDCRRLRESALHTAGVARGLTYAVPTTGHWRRAIRHERLSRCLCSEVGPCLREHLVALSVSERKRVVDVSMYAEVERASSCKVSTVGAKQPQDIVGL